MTDKSIYQTHRPGSTDGLYLKPKDGDRVQMRLVSAPAISTYDGERMVYNWVVWTRRVNGQEVNKPQVLSKGSSVFMQIADIVESWGDPISYDIVVKRTGSTMQDTEYSVTPVKESPDLTKSQEDEAQKIDLLSACKGRWLYEYEKDGQLPDPIKQVDKAVEVPDGDIEIEDLGSSDDKINPEDIPF